MFLINIMWHFVYLRTNIQKMKKLLLTSYKIPLLNYGKSETTFSICIKSKLSFIQPCAIRR